MKQNYVTITLCINACYSASGRGAEYFDERVCLSECVSVCLFVRHHISGNTRPIFVKFLCMLPVAVARSSSGGVAIRYVLPVVRMTSYLLISQGCLTSPPTSVHTQPWAWL